MKLAVKIEIEAKEKDQLIKEQKTEIDIQKIKIGDLEKQLKQILKQ